jgi:hypothetical protein
MVRTTNIDENSVTGLKPAVRTSAWHSEAASPLQKVVERHTEAGWLVSEITLRGTGTVRMKLSGNFV